DLGRPEPELFLMKAAEDMVEYLRQHGHYAGSWQGLDFMFCCGGCYRSDPRIRPRSDQEAEWRPLGCRFTYVIRSAGKDAFLVQAVADDGVVEYELRERMTRPRRAWAIAPLFQSCAPPCDGYDPRDERAKRLGKDPSLSLAASFEVSGSEL